jgi:hypothetical protein
MFDRRAVQSARKSTVRLLCALLALVVTFIVSAPSQTEGTAEIRIRLIDGRNGKPIAAGEFLVLESSAPADRKQLTRDATTGPDGYAAISVPVDFKGSFIVGPVGKPNYEQCISWNGKREFSVEAIRTTGVVSKNTCRRKITQSPVPGVLIVYLRPERLCDRMSDIVPCFWN